MHQSVLGDVQACQYPPVRWAWTWTRLHFYAQVLLGLHPVQCAPPFLDVWRLLCILEPGQRSFLGYVSFRDRGVLS